jgi:hypothetical protein
MERTKNTSKNHLKKARASYFVKMSVRQEQFLDGNAAGSGCFEFRVETHKFFFSTGIVGVDSF